jgi:DNA invertase Pin-like site-specific DNA recombinase
MKACIYCRVSTSGQNTDNQLSVLTDWVKQRGYDLVETYAETEGAWRGGHQKALATLTSDARKGRFNLVIVWALDRLSREGALAILSLVHKLQAYGVKVISYQESWTEAPGELGEILYALAGWVARMESHRRSERTKAGLNRAIAQGKTLGRPKGSKDKRKRKKRAPKIESFLAM